MILLTRAARPRTDQSLLDRTHDAEPMNPVSRGFLVHSPSTCRRCSSRISSAILVRDCRTSSANGALGLHKRQDNAGMRLVTAASRCRSSVRRSTALIVRQAGQRTQRYQQRAAIAAPIVGENSIGIRLAWRSFQAAISRSASSRTWASVARRLAASFSAASRRWSFHLAAVEAHTGNTVAGWAVRQATLYVSGDVRTLHL